MNQDTVSQPSQVQITLLNPAMCGKYWLTDKEYSALLNLYHEYNDAYLYLPDYIQLAFKARLFSPR